MAEQNVVEAQVIGKAITEETKLLEDERTLTTECADENIMKPPLLEEMTMKPPVGTSRAAKRNTNWRPEVSFCVPFYAFALAVEIGIFFYALFGKRRRQDRYQDHHFPVLCLIVGIPISVLLGIVSLSPIDEEALYNDPEYASDDPELRAAAVRRQLRMSQLVWKASIWVNTVICIALSIAYGMVTNNVANNLKTPDNEIGMPNYYFVYTATMGVAYVIAACCNIKALRRVRRLGRRGFPAGLDSLTLEAEALIGGGGETSVSSAGTEGGTKVVDNGNGIRQRHAGGKLLIEKSEAGTPGLASMVIQQFMTGEIDRTNLEVMLKISGVKLELDGRLRRLIFQHDRTGDVPWEDFQAALRSAIGTESDVPYPTPEQVPPPPEPEPEVPENPQAAETAEMQEPAGTSENTEVQEPAVTEESDDDVTF